MINDDTELIYVDEWSDDTISADLAKVLLQGGYFPQSVKDQNPKLQNNQAGVFIACNKTPDFGDEQENVERRLAFFHTKSLNIKLIEAPQWIEDNAMQCLVWMANLLNRHEDLIPTDGRFYENNTICASSAGGIPRSEVTKMKTLSFKNFFHLAPTKRSSGIS